MMILSWGGTRILVRTTNFQDVSPVWAVTLSPVGGRYVYRADYRGQIGYGYDNNVTEADIWRIDDFNTASPVETRLEFALHPGVQWAYGGWWLYNLAVSTDDPSVIAVGVRQYQAGTRRFHVSSDSGGSWTFSDPFPSETSYYGNQGSGQQGVWPIPGMTNSWFMLAKCGWDGPMYDYRMVGTDLPGASRSEIEPAVVQFSNWQLVASGSDSLGALWFYAHDAGVAEGMFRGTIGAGLSQTGPFDAPIAMPYSPSTPGVIVGGQVKVYFDGWTDLGTTALIKDAFHLAPCGLDTSDRWAVGGYVVDVDPIVLDPIVKYTGNGG
ncbi:MAG: hypothetical protein GY700_12390, partial [Propionibacteriaceae bacterium]|nr:hypothetical protein [Propionibacteriaceae bacterium]